MTTVMPMGHDRAPSHKKPALPRMTDIAARLRTGDTLDQVAAEYDRVGASLIPHLSNAGYGTDGHPLNLHPVDDRPTALHAWVMPLWYDDALCATTDPELFYPETGGSINAALRVCAACPVRQQCADDAIERGEVWGVWGATGPGERRRLRTKKGLAS